MLRPHRECSTFGMRDLIRVPSPAARTMTATGRGWLTAASRLGLRAGRFGLRKDQPAEPPAGTGQDASGSGCDGDSVYPPLICRIPSGGRDRMAGSVTA